MYEDTYTKVNYTCKKRHIKEIYIHEKNPIKGTYMY